MNSPCIAPDAYRAAARSCLRCARDFRDDARARGPMDRRISRRVMRGYALEWRAYAGRANAMPSPALPQ
jgi:hypothetical protein